MQTTSKTAPQKKKSVDYYLVVTRKVIKHLEQGEIPWRKVWEKPYMDFAKNYYSDHKYKGINWLMLNLMSGHNLPYYMTMYQINKLGGNVLRGSKANAVYYFNSYYRNSKGKIISHVEARIAQMNHEEVQRISYLKKHSVFNIQCTNKIKWREPISWHQTDSITLCDTILDTMKIRPKIKHQKVFDAYYNPVLDCIIMPQFKAFNDPEGYYVILFHNIITWTGHQSRLDRNGLAGNYNLHLEESLIAEIGASMLAAIVGIKQLALLEQPSQYLNLWLQALEEDKRFIFRVATKAQQAVDFVLSDSLMQ